MKALLIVDMQNDFMPGGALGVKGGNEIVSLINSLIPHFSLIVASQDWHPANHVSFATSHPGKKPGDQIEVQGESQVLWPAHCVQGSYGAEIVAGLNQEKIAHFFHKGTDKKIDSYSVFFDNARQKSTGLADFLKKHKAKEVYLVGLATDYCVLYSTLDAIDLGFSVTVIADACRPVNLHPHDEEKAFAAITARGGKIVTASEIISGAV